MNRYVMTLFLVCLFHCRSVSCEEENEPASILKWVQTQINALKQRLSSGVSVEELETLKRYLIGIDESEAEILEKEIDQLLSETQITFQNAIHSPEKEISAVSIESGVSMSPDICESMSTVIMATETVVKANSSTVLNTELIEKEKNILTATLTEVIPSTIFRTETLTIKAIPKLSTLTLLLSRNNFKTIETTLLEEEWKTKFVHLTETQIDVAFSYDIFTTQTPAYVTFIETHFKTLKETVTETQFFGSTLIVTDVEYYKIPVTVTKTSHTRLEQVVTVTEFSKKMITVTSTTDPVETLTTKCVKNFFEDVKKFIG